MKVLLVVLLLSGCATSTIVYDETGREALLIQCDASLAVCHNKAREVCGGAYALLDEFNGQYKQHIKVRCGDDLDLLERLPDRNI
jgi:hypothetical protein